MTSDERGDKFKIGDIVVRMSGWDNLIIEPIGLVVEVLEVDGDGLPLVKHGDGRRMYINDSNYDVHEMMKSPLYQALA
jgi:hypothetical protein